MKIILYESGSRGGNFEYSKKLFETYKEHSGVESIEWIIPSSADVNADDGVSKILLDDRRSFNKLYFFYRSLVNPLILFRYLRSKKESHFVILNDFEQLTAPLWVPLYKLFLRRHTFGVFLHDPDRDAYPPSKAISGMSMKMLMSLSNIAFYHQYLPDKPYYKPNGKTLYLDVPHGQYERHPSDPDMTSRLTSVRNNDKLVSIIGNIRLEKNYELAITAVARIPGIRLIIAGSPSSSSVNLETLEQLAAQLKVSARVTFIVKYLSDTEMASVIEASDVVLLNYKNTFTSQSGIFNLLAPYKKRVIVSRTSSALANIALKFNIGYFVAPDDLDELVKTLQVTLSSSNSGDDQWSGYLQYASWKNHVNIVIDALKKIHPDAV